MGGGHTERFSLRRKNAARNHASAPSCGLTTALSINSLARSPISEQKLGPLLVQLPPSLAFSKKTATGFLDLLRERFTGDIALEPRHASWFCTDVEEQLRKRKIARVKADPAEPSGAARPGGWHGFMYYRLHGSPRTYWSDYSTGDLERIAQEIIARREEGARVWCVFDNTAEDSPPRMH